MHLALIVPTTIANHPRLWYECMVLMYALKTNEARYSSKRQSVCQARVEKCPISPTSMKSQWLVRGAPDTTNTRLKILAW